METPKPENVSTRGDSQFWSRRTSIHPWIEKLNLGPRLLVFAADKAVALIDTLRSVDGEDLSESATTTSSR